ncbi:SAM-dependent methyltransferase [Legionella sp. CNM-1927-20]|uniref:SAM-dependent methyltransferase n=1 Tax=Legionella sp. CNM-1927-20 TaxID=3422221 RepID=UPI00403AA443
MNKLFIAGCGIKFLSHITLETQSLIRKSDCVVYLVNDPAMKRWIMENSKKGVSLDSIYFSFKERKKAYSGICQEIINIANIYSITCFVTYGHPLILSSCSQQLIKDIEEQSPNIQVEIVPGISSLDSLFCDLRIDPGLGGIQAYEATEFSNNNYKINSNSHLILWQIGVAGIKAIINNDKELKNNIERKNTIVKIKHKLLNFYKENHTIVLYVASMYPSIPFEKIDVLLTFLDEINIPRLSTAYIHPI